MPCSISDLVGALDSLITSFNDASRMARLELARHLLEEEVERLCRDIRHKYQNVLAAQRLLLGAFIAGDISPDILQQTAAALGNKDQGPLKQLIDPQSEATSCSTEGAGEFGWRPVYQALLRTKHFDFDIVGAGSYEEGFNYCRDGTLDKAEFIILYQVAKQSEMR